MKTWLLFLTIGFASLSLAAPFSGETYTGKNSNAVSSACKTRASMEAKLNTLQKRYNRYSKSEFAQSVAQSQQQRLKVELGLSTMRTGLLRLNDALACDESVRTPAVVSASSGAGVVPDLDGLCAISQNLIKKRDSLKKVLERSRLNTVEINLAESEMTEGVLGVYRSLGCDELPVN